MTEPMYVSVAGTKHYYGSTLLRPGLTVLVVKEPGNAHDAEAIRVELPPIGKIGYIANSTRSVAKGCSSAGRIYDRIGIGCYGIVRFVAKDTAIVELQPQLSAMPMTGTFSEDIKLEFPRYL